MRAVPTHPGGGLSCSRPDCAGARPENQDTGLYGDAGVWKSGPTVHPDAMTSRTTHMTGRLVTAHAR